MFESLNETVDKCYDEIFIQYIGDLKYQSVKGFYDTDCVDQNYAYYNSVKELLINEIFEAIISFVNKKAQIYILSI